MSFGNILRYINDTIGDVTDLGQVSDAKMPLYLKSEFRFERVKILEQNFILAKFQSDESTTIDKLKNRKDKMSGYLAKEDLVVFVFNEIGDYQRKRLIEEKISFIVPGKMIFILELGTVFSEKANSKYSTNQNFINERMKPSTQALLLYLLRNQDFSLTMTEIASEVSISIMSVSRAFKELILLGLIKSDERDDNEKFSLNGNRKEVWEKAIPYMSNPVMKTIYIEPDSLTTSQLNQLNLSGESALSTYSMISAPSNEVFGIHKKVFKENFNNIKILPLKERNSIVVQLYNHTLYSNGKILDELSTALVLLDEFDERVKGEVNRMLDYYFHEEVTHGTK